MKYQLLNAIINLLRESKSFRNALVEYKNATDGINLDNIKTLENDNQIMSELKDLNLFLLDIRTKLKDIY
jgi:hypothetical protein